jgi:CheY-like chemotaxis protein
MTEPTLVSILVADDDEEDHLLLRDALIEGRLRNPVEFVVDGEGLLDRLRGSGRYAGDPPRRLPGLILVDLDMPRMNGLEAIREIKADPTVRDIPLVVLTTSTDEGDIDQSYDLGVASYIVKPVTFGALVDVMRELGRYWFDVVELPDA